MNGFVRVTASLLAVSAGIFALGATASFLGDWTDAHPDKSTLVWTLWNFALVALAIALIQQWRKHRRERQNSPPQSSRHE